MVTEDSRRRVRRVSPLRGGAPRAWLCALSLGCSLSQELGAQGRDVPPARDVVVDDRPQELAVTFSAVAAGGARSCALSSGRALCWGDFLHGGLGRDVSSPDARPTAVPGLSAMERLALGRDHACAAGAAVWCWGDARDGRRGVGEAKATTAPNEVPGIGRVDRLVAGRSTTCARTLSGAWWCWGPWGLPDTPYWAPQATPELRSELAGADAVGIGTAHLCGLWRRDDGGVVRCRGVNVNGQLGDGTDESRDALVDFVDATGAPDASITALAVGARHTCVVSRGRTAVSCRGALAGGAGRVATFAAEAPIEAVATGDAHVCFSTASGAVWCWGDNASGQLGDGTLDAREAPARVVVPDGVLLTDVTAGGAHTCARARDGLAVWCWGDNQSAQVGGATGARAATPVRVTAR